MDFPIAKALELADVTDGQQHCSEHECSSLSLLQTRATSRQYSYLATAIQSTPIRNLIFCQGSGSLLVSTGNARANMQKYNPTQGFNIFLR